MRISIFDIDRWQEILQSISRHKLRTALTGFGVFWGILMLVLLLGMGKGLENGIHNQFDGEATNSVWIWADNTTKPYKGSNPGRRWNMEEGDVRLVTENVDKIDLIAPRNFIQGEFTVRRNQKYSAFEVLSTTPGYRKVKTSIITAGRFINQADIEEKRKVAYIGIEVYKALFDSSSVQADIEKAIGQNINIKGTEFTVIGIFENRAGDRETRRIYIPFSTARNVMRAGTNVDLIVLNSNATEIKDFKEQETQIRQTLARIHGFDPNDKDALRINSPIEILQNIIGLFIGIKWFVWIVGIATLMAGVVGVSNVMMIVVKERTKEIGIRKAMGATPADIIGMVLQESIMITGFCGYLGLVVGVAILEAVRQALGSGDGRSFFLNPEIDLIIAVSATLILVFVGALAGFFPAYHAAKVQPVEALSAELN